jgi:hypothetical protein
MPKTRLSDGAVSFLRRIAVVIGLIFIIVAFTADMIGLSAGTGLSGNQIAFGVIGLILIIAGILGRKFSDVYRGSALMLLNMVIALILLDFMSLALVKIIDPERFTVRAAKLERGTLALVEHTVIIGQYAPYVVWRANPNIANDSTRIDENGYRLTPGSSPDPEAYKVFLMGGSSMWGTSVADSGTISFYLQRDLPTLMDRPVSVSNMAQIGFASTQEVIELMLQLRSGNIPDMVIYYDGFNDVSSAYTNGFAGGHFSQTAIAERVEGRTEEFEMLTFPEVLFRYTNIWLLFTSLRERASHREEGDYSNLLTYSTMGIDKDSLAAAVVDAYLGNCRVVESLSESFGFECLFVWQPSIWVGDKPLTEYERTIAEGGFDFFLAGGDPAFRGLMQASYDIYSESMPASLRYRSFASIFDEVDDEVYIDYSGVHVKPWANELIAAAFVNAMNDLNPLMHDGTRDEGSGTTTVSAP